MHHLPQEDSRDAHEFVVRVSPKGQITIPKIIRDTLGVRPKDKVVVRLDGGKITVTPVVSSLGSILSTTPTRVGTESAARMQSTPTHLSSVCAEAPGMALPATDRFQRAQGVSVFTTENTDGAVSNDRVRAITVNEQGVWAGYFPTGTDKKGGIGFFDKRLWGDCNLPQALEQAEVNALTTDVIGRLWMGTEGQGIAMLDEGQWHLFGTDEGLPSADIFGLTADAQGTIWAATWEGIVKYESGSWSVPYSIYNHTLHNNHTHTIAFDSRNNIWVGHMRGAGMSLYRNDDGQWHHLTGENSQLAGDEVRSIVVREANEHTPESVWIGTADGGISRVEGETWTTYRTADGLPSNQISALRIDKYGRVWAATSQGTVYFEDNEWIRYNTLPTLSLAFAPMCSDCPFEKGEHVWTGTDGFGLTHSRLPYLDNDEVVEVQDVCFLTEEGRQRLCPPLERNADVTALQAKLPVALHPGQPFRVEVFVAPRAPYRFQAGDFLANTDSDDALLFGAWRHMAVDRTVEPGEPFAFSHYDTPFVAPDVAPGQSGQKFTSTWRVWMRTRYVGPSVEISFDVVQPTVQGE